MARDGVWSVKRAELLPILPDWSVVVPSFYAVMPPGRVDVLKVRAFLDHLAGWLGQVPAWDTALPIPAGDPAGRT